MKGEMILVILILIGLIGRSPLIATAASLLLIIKLIHLERFLPSLERRGMEFGLLFLTIAVLVPFAAERITWRDVTHIFTSVPGMIALIGGALATYMNGKGLDLLKMDPQLTVAMVMGSIFGILFLRGIPVGPLMAAGITALFLQVIHYLWN